MKHSLISPGAWFVFGIVGILLPPDTFAQHRVVVEPSVEIVGTHDDNLFFSDDERPASDFIQRVRPTVDLRFDSPRWSAKASYGIDSDRYATHSSLDNTRARQRALMGIQYEASPRLTLAMDGTYLDTDTLSDLNAQTGLGASRLHASQLSFRPSARFQISPRLTARASSFSTTTNVTNGPGMRAHVQTLGIERKVTPRDLLTVDYEQGNYVFDVETAGSTNTHTLLAGWTRSLGPRTRLMVQGGPRITEGSPTAELSASLTHDWRFSSMAISCMQTQTAVVGHAGTVETQILQGRFAYAPTRSLSAYAAPAVFRSTQGNLSATVYRIGVGARYAFTPLVGVDLAYSHDSQRGSIDPSLAGSEFSHSMLSVSLTTRWNSANDTGAGRLR